jgi:hypothetical protein
MNAAFLVSVCIPANDARCQSSSAHGNIAAKCMCVFASPTGWLSAENEGPVSEEVPTVLLNRQNGGEVVGFDEKVRERGCWICRKELPFNIMPCYDSIGLGEIHHNLDEGLFLNVLSIWRFPCSLCL